MSREIVVNGSPSRLDAPRSGQRVTAHLHVVAVDGDGDGHLHTFYLSDA
jgi:hypothetical protein